MNGVSGVLKNFSRGELSVMAWRGGPKGGGEGVKWRGEGVREGGGRGVPTPPTTVVINRTAQCTKESIPYR